MSSRARVPHRRYQTNANHRQRPTKRPVRQSNDQICSNLIQQFNIWCTSLRTHPAFEFDNDAGGNHRCKMTLPVFPNLQSIGNGANTKRESKANAIIAFLAHMEKRKQVGLFVPYMIPNLFRDVQVELRRATVASPDMNLNRNEYLLAEKIVSKLHVKKSEHLMKIVERICDVRVIMLWQSSKMAFVYVVGAQGKEESIAPFVKALLQPEHEQYFHYGEKLFDIFNDDTFLDDVCQRLKVLCSNCLEKCQLLIRGSSVNVQCCYNEFGILRFEYEDEFSRLAMPSKDCQPESTGEPQASTPIDPEEKESDQLPDYSFYDDDVNASILRVLRNEETNEESTQKIEHPPVIIEISDDSSDGTDVQLVQAIEQRIPPPAPTSVAPLRPIQPQDPPGALPAQSRILRHIVLDGQNIARNSNDNSRSFSWCRLSNAIQYFKNRGHTNIIAFLPLYLREFLNRRASATEVNQERKIRDDMINARLIAFTPSRYNNGKRLTNYDDRFILQYAADNDGIVVSNDNFRDLQHEPSFRAVIHHGILPFATINDTFMPATDPLGRNGPHLDEFLSRHVCQDTQSF